MYRKILIAVDDSPAAEKVALKGFQLGHQLNAEIALLSIVDTEGLMTDGNITPGELVEMWRDDFKNRHKMLMNNVFKDYKVWTFVEEGKPHKAIIKAADEWKADLIVIGSHGRTGLDRLLMGSVAEHVIRHSSIPVLIVPSRE